MPKRTRPTGSTGSGDRRDIFLKSERMRISKEGWAIQPMFGTLFLLHERILSDAPFRSYHLH